MSLRCAAATLDCVCGSTKCEREGVSGERSVVEESSKSASYLEAKARLLPSWQAGRQEAS